MQFTIRNGGVTPIEFMLCFSEAERVAIRSSADAYVLDFLRILDDPRLTMVYLGMPFVARALSKMVDLELLDEARVPQILEAEMV